MLSQSPTWKLWTRFGWTVLAESDHSKTLSSFVNIVIFWYPFLLFMLHSTHFPLISEPGCLRGFFCRFYIFIFYFWCIFNKLGFACHRAIAIKKKVPRYPWLGWMLVRFSIRCFAVRHDATPFRDVSRAVQIPIQAPRRRTSAFIMERFGECCPLLDKVHITVKLWWWNDSWTSKPKQMTSRLEVQVRNLTTAN